MIVEHATGTFPRSIPTGRRRSRLNLLFWHVLTRSYDILSAAAKPILIISLVVTGIVISTATYFTVDQMRCEERVTAMKLTYHYTVLGGCFIVGGDGGYIPIDNFTLSGNP